MAPVLMSLETCRVYMGADWIVIRAYPICINVAGLDLLTISTPTSMSMSDSSSFSEPSSSDEAFTVLSEGYPPSSSPREAPARTSPPLQLRFPTLPTDFSDDESPPPSSSSSSSSSSPSPSPSPSHSLTHKRSPRPKTPVWTLISSLILMLAVTAIQIWRLQATCEACKILRHTSNCSGYAVKVSIYRPESIHDEEAAVIVITPPECRHCPSQLMHSVRLVMA